MPGPSSETEDLQKRAYRDADGKLHHHTRDYMRRHGGDDGAGAKGQTSTDGARARTAAKPRNGSGRTSGKTRAQHSGKVTTDHEQIRRWAERQGGKPAAVARTHDNGDVGIIRIMFPEAPNSEHDALTEISWEEFFREFEGRNLALLHEEDGMFSKIIGRETADKRAKGDHGAAR